MTPEQAIRILTDELNYGEGSHELVLEHAIKLGIEALKRLREMRHSQYHLPYPPLPGETNE